jgi:hypothetical protein
MKDLFSNKQLEISEPYKDPVFLFTSSSMRFAAWAGWYSAFGDKDRTERMCHQTHAEWVKELGMGRKYSFVDRRNDDLYKYLSEEQLKGLVDNFLKTVKDELKKAKASEAPDKSTL